MFIRNDDNFRFLGYVLASSQFNNSEINRFEYLGGEGMN